MTSKNTRGQKETHQHRCDCCQARKQQREADRIWMLRNEQRGSKQRKNIESYYSRKAEYAEYVRRKRIEMEKEHLRRYMIRKYSPIIVRLLAIVVAFIGTFVIINASSAYFGMDTAENILMAMLGSVICGVLLWPTCILIGECVIERIRKIF